MRAILVGVLSLALAGVGCGGSSSSDPGACTATGAGGTSSSSTAEKTSLCETIATKCPQAAESSCEADLAGASSAYVQAYETCLSEWKKCDDDLDVCRDRAMSEIAPGFPNVPIVSECRDKAEECKAAIPNETRSYFDADCTRLVRLDEAGQSRATECATKECDAFYSCIRSL